MKKSTCSMRVSPDESFRKLLFEHPQLQPMIHALGLRGPYGDASIRQVSKDQSIHEPVLVSLLDASLCKDFEWNVTFPAYGLLQLCDMTRAVMEHLLLQLNWIPQVDYLQLKAHQEELEQIVLPHINGIYELYYSPEYTSGKTNLLRYSIEFFPKKSLPKVSLQNIENRLEAEAGSDSGRWQKLLDFHHLVELTIALERVEERLLKPVVLQMEEEIITTFQKKKYKPLRLAFLKLPAVEPIPELLSKREQEVLGLVAQGLMNKEIADKLNISLTTVISHRKHIAGKLGIHTLAGLTVYAYTHGFLDEVILTNED